MVIWWLFWVSYFVAGVSFAAYIYDDAPEEDRVSFCLIMFFVWPLILLLYTIMNIVEILSKFANIKF